MLSLHLLSSEEEEEETEMKEEQKELDEEEMEEEQKETGEEKEEDEGILPLQPWLVLLQGWAAISLPHIFKTAEASQLRNSH